MRLMMRLADEIIKGFCFASGAMVAYWLLKDILIGG